MNTPRPQTVRGGRRRVWLLGLCALVHSSLWGAGKAGIGYFSPEARLWLDESQVIPFRVAAPTESGRALDTAVDPPDAAEILQPAVVLGKETQGFLRLRARRTGAAELIVDGARLPLRIEPNPSAEVIAPRPTLICPPEGACVYGTFTAGVEINTVSPDDVPSEPRLLLPDGREISPRSQTISGPGSVRLYAFDVNADELPAGPLALRPVAKDAHGRRLAGDRVMVNVIRPDTSVMISGACVDRVNDPRPARFGEKPPPVAPAGGTPEYVENFRPDPAWCVQETIDKPGWYQLTMRVRGRPALGSFPSVGVVLNDDNQALSGSRLVDHAWHRIPIGVPFRLEAGKQNITARFLNDFSRGKGNDRDLFLERYELVRVSADEAAPADSDGAGMMMGGGAEVMMMGASRSGLVGDPSALRVAFAERLEGRLVQGPLQLKVVARRGNRVKDAPRVELLVNGETVGRQQGREPNFYVPVSALRKGTNTLQLRARTDAGHFAESPAESVVLDAEPDTRPGGRVLRFTVEDDAWDPGLAQKLEKDRPVAAFYVNGDAILTLPHNLEGEFAFAIEARGQEFHGPPLIEAFLQIEGRPLEKIGELPVREERIYRFGQVQLPRGPKQIVVRFSNDAAVAGQGDRNWWLRAARLEEKTPSSDEAPQITVLHPRRSPFRVGEADAVVVRVYSPAGIAWTDLVVDGQPLNLRQSEDSGLGRVVLPLLTADLAPGDHTLQVRARGRNGRETTSAAVVLRVGADGTDRQFARAVHLLNRFGYGPEPEELADILILGEKAWLQDRLARPWSDPGEVAAWRRAWTEYPDPVNKGQVVPRSLAHLLRSPNPVRTRFVLWAENHFSTWIDKADALNKWTEHVRFLELGVAPFGTLLKASASSPAMLIYLDQNRSFARRLNENYAREVMELHTVGVDAGYTQQDVTALASVLTGWTISSDAPLRGQARDLARSFRFDPLLNSPAEKRVFGMEFPRAEDPALRQDRTLAALEMLAGHPATARFISRKLAEHYVSVPAPDSLVQKLTDRFLGTGGDMAALLMTIAESPEFWEAANRPKIATPLDYSLRLARLCGSGSVGTVRDFLRRSGMGLFERATPDGYPEEDAAYVDSNALLQRWRFTLAMGGSLRKFLPSGFSAGQNSGESDWSRSLDLASLRLTGHLLPVRSREAALQYLKQISPPENERAKVITTLVAQLPTASLR
jgi:hypothetical protein